MTELSTAPSADTSALQTAADLGEPATDSLGPPQAQPEADQPTAPHTNDDAAKSNAAADQFEAPALDPTAEQETSAQQAQDLEPAAADQYDALPPSETSDTALEPPDAPPATVTSADADPSAGEALEPLPESFDAPGTPSDAQTPNQATPDARDTTPAASDDARAAPPLGTAPAPERTAPEANPAAEDANGPRSTNPDEQKPEEATKTPTAEQRRGRDDPEADRAVEIASQRSAELQGQVPDNARGRITMGVSVGRDGADTLRTVVSTSEPRGYLRPGVTLKPGEELSRGDGHAEVSGINYMRENKINPIAVGAGRPICGPCADTINDAGALPATPLKKRQ